MPENHVPIWNWQNKSPLEKELALTLAGFVLLSVGLYVLVIMHLPSMPLYCLANGVLGSC